LLQLSRSKLRETFSSVVPRFVFTLNFERLPQLHCDVDRLAEDGMRQYSDAAMLGNKLDRIRKLSGICVTTPDAVKSLELTFIDMISSRDRVKKDPFGPAAEKLMKMKDVIQSLHDVLILWRERGLALFDEASLNFCCSLSCNFVIIVFLQVDMILNPLRSELNFPMGTEKHYDLADVNQSAPRWQLPSFLFEILSQAAADASQGTQDSLKNVQSLYPFFPSACRQSLQAVVDGLRRGATAHNIRLVSSTLGEQRSAEHFAILNPTFYDTELRREMSKFALEWVIYTLSDFVKCQVEGVAIFEQDTFGALRPIMQKFILGFENPSESEKYALRSLGPTSVMLLSLTKQWITVYLSHCLSLFNRVHYGLLQPRDIERLERQGVDPKRIPGSRFRNAVPFVGKDSPSRASEFAQPDISAGLTILAYRYEGLRKTDLHALVQVPF
jgi:hypothetical protein